MARMLGTGTSSFGGRCRHEGRAGAQIRSPCRAGNLRVRQPGVAQPSSGPGGCPRRPRSPRACARRRRARPRRSGSRTAPRPPARLRDRFMLAMLTPLVAEHACRCGRSCPGRSSLSRNSIGPASSISTSWPERAHHPRAGCRGRSGCRTSPHRRGSSRRGSGSRSRSTPARAARAPRCRAARPRCMAFTMLHALVHVAQRADAARRASAGACRARRCWPA